MIYTTRLLCFTTSKWHKGLRKTLNAGIKKGSVNKMKTMIMSKVCFCAVITALVSGCQVTVGPGPAAVVVTEPVVEVVPDTYVWDGVEYVGVYNGQYMYFGPAGVWVVCDPFILERFHGWERGHADWREHAIRNDREHRLDREHRSGAPNRMAAPERKTAAPEHRAVAPERKTAAPENRAVAPERKTAAPENRAVAPEKRTAAPVSKTVAPERKTAAPENRAVAPAQKTAAPAKKAAAPEKKKEDKKDEK
jgi:hypothetical protein